MAASDGYVGRFAPSPTGPLHFGSLVAAGASWLDARRHHGRWLLRIEDLDRPRVVPGAEASILHALEAFALEWDGTIVRQSERGDLYAAALETLRRDGLTFDCSCSRRELGAESEANVYPGTCRARAMRPGPHATRFRIDDARIVEFDDGIQGRCRYRLGDLGDFIVRRRDGVVAYQLAVVVDDAEQGVTDVVRGADLLASTPWQIALCDALHLSHPRYMHVPLVLEPDGTKLSKSRRSLPLEPTHASATIVAALHVLGLGVPATLEGAGARELWAWAATQWTARECAGRATSRLIEP